MLIFWPLRFLIAQLQMAYLLTRRHAIDARKALGTLPETVSEFYVDSLQRMESMSEKERHLSQKVLSFVFHARRTLSLEELQHALSVDPESTDLRKRGLNNNLLISLTLGFIRVGSESNQIQLAHYTLYEYLKKTPLAFAADERSLAATCLGYLMLEPFASGPCLEEREILKRLDDYAFFDYACQYWSQHAQTCMDRELWTLALAFLNNKQKLASCVQARYYNRRRAGA